MVHFVGFRTPQQYRNAVAVFGLPDFVHHLNDARLWFGGEMGENDVVVFANGSEARYKEFSYNDSEVQ